MQPKKQTHIHTQNGTYKMFERLQDNKT